MAQKPFSATFYNLCSEIMQDSRRFPELVSSLLEFFIKFHPPKPPGKHISEETLSISSQALDVFYTISHNLQTSQASSSPFVQLRVSAIIRKSFPEFFPWVSFLVRTYVERDLEAHRDFDDMGLHTIKVVAEFVGALLLTETVGGREMRLLNGAADMIIQIHLYSFMLDPTTHLRATSNKDTRIHTKINTHLKIEDIYKCSADMFGEYFLIGDDSADIFWREEYPCSVARFNHRFVPIFARVLSHLVQEPKLNFNGLNIWLRAVVRAIQYSKSFNSRLFPHRFIIFITHLICRISRLFAHPVHGSSSRRHWDVIGTFRWCIFYVMYTLENEGFDLDVIISCVELGLLEGLWRASAALVKYTDGPNPAQLVVLMDESRDILGCICRAAVFRSVQKPLMRIIHKFPAYPVGSTSSKEVQSTDLEHVWGWVRKMVEDRVRLRQQWEEKIILCSNPQCKTPPKTKLYRCSSCKYSFYCSRTCQKSHWTSEHREECKNLAKELGNPFTPRQPEERDAKLMRNITHSEIWFARALVFQQRDALAKESSSRIVNYFDATVMEMFAWTEAEAKATAKVKAPDSELHWDRADVKKAFEDGTPVILVKYPHWKDAYFLLVLNEPSVLHETNVPP